MEILSRIYYFIGSLVCHQLPKRTIYIDDAPLPFCARDTGIYLGIFIALIYCIVRGKLKSDRTPSTGISIFLALLMLPMMTDAVTSYASFRQTDNVIRFLTGIFFGMSVAIFLIPAANFKVYEDNKQKVIDGWLDLGLLSIVNILVCIIILRFNILLWTVVSTASLIGLVFIIGRLVYTLIRILNIGDPKRNVLYASALTIAVFGLLYILRYFLLGPIRSLLFSFF